MAISGLLPMLKDISEELHIRSFAGQVAAIEAYCWIHKAAILCTEELILGTESSRYVESENECLSLIIWFCSYVVDLTEAEIELNVSNVFSRYVELCMKYGRWMRKVTWNLQGKGENLKSKRCFVFKTSRSAWLI